jgi:alpha-D-xyloside xylohydrolase
LRVYPGADGSFTLYEDENDGYQYEKGRFATTQLDWSDGQRQLEIHATKGSFPGMLKHRVFRVVLVTEGHGVGVEMETVIDKTVEFTGRELMVKIP